MRNKNLKTEIYRQALTIQEAAFMYKVGEKSFVRRFVATKKIMPVVYDEEQGNDILFDYDDVKQLTKNARIELPEWFLDRLKKGESITGVLQEKKMIVVN